MIFLSYQIGVRYKNFKLVWGQPLMLHRSYRKNEAPQPSVLELYDLHRDPGERDNIAGSNAEMVRYLQGFALQEYKSLVPPKTGILALHTVRYDVLSPVDVLSSATRPQHHRLVPGGQETSLLRPLLRPASRGPRPPRPLLRVLQKFPVWT